MINIKLRMSIEQIIFNLLNKNAHTWVRYWQQKEMSGLTMPGEYIEIRTFFLSGIELSDFLEAGFKINKIQSQKIDADARLNGIENDIQKMPKDNIGRTNNNRFLCIMLIIITCVFWVLGNFLYMDLNQRYNELKERHDMVMRNISSDKTIK